MAGKRTLIVKVGSRVLAGDGGIFERLARGVDAARKEGRPVVIVSSGAIAFGIERLKLKKRPKAMPELQAAAAAGQSALVRRWEEALGAKKLNAAQVLLTHADLADRSRYLNARRAIGALLEWGAVPVVNENDTVAIEEIQFGDNDQLAASLVPLVGADLLVLLTDVDGVRGADGKFLAEVTDIDREAAPFAVDPKPGTVGRGGMRSKIEAARRATLSGATCIVANGARDRVLEAILAGEAVGTRFVPRTDPLAARKHWIAFTLKPAGSLTVDAGAVEALTRRHKSLLPSGITKVEGRFAIGEPVRILGPDGVEIARGLAGYPAEGVAKIAGGRSTEIAERLGYRLADEVVHKDDLVLLGG